MLGDMQRNSQDNTLKYLSEINGHLKNIVLIISIEQKILELNASAKWLFGITKDIEYSDEHSELLHFEKNWFPIKKGITKFLESGSASTFKSQVSSPDRKIRTISWQIDKLADTTEETNRIAILGTDITAPNHDIKLLRERDLRFQLLVDQAGDAFFILDDEGKIFDVNPRACLNLGYTHEELLKMNILEVDIDADEKQHRRLFWNLLDTGQYITFEGKHKRKDGTTFPVEIRLGRLDLDGRKLFLALCRDISERKQRETELLRAFKKINVLKEKLERENTYLRNEIDLSYRHEKIIGESALMKSILSQAQKVAKTNTCVLILGETGTGKELLAHAIHSQSNRNGQSMIKVNCAALPATLIESELFGREKGAFTGALKKQIGRFELAHGTTIFLDEIGDLPIELQSKLLRVLQEGQFERLGSNKTISVDVRIIAATNRNLPEMVHKQKFRQDLYYRLNVFPITLPPLRDRQEDIPLLTWEILGKLSKSMGKSVRQIRKKDMEFLTQHTWPGNVRELKNVIERAMILSTSPTLKFEFLSDMDIPENVHIPSSLKEVEKKHILKVLGHTNWRVSGKNGAADILSLKPTTLEARMKKLGIKRPVEG